MKKLFIVFFIFITPILFADKIKDFVNAAGKGDLKKVKALLKEGVKVNAKGQKGFTALIYAAQEGKLKVIQYLIRKRAKVNAKTEDGATALQMAASGGHVQVVKLLLRKRAKVNVVDNLDKNTALMDAASRGHLAVIKLLLRKGAKINLTNGQGYTALALALRDNHDKVAKYLLKRRASIYLKLSTYQKAPSVLFMVYHKPKLLKIFLKKAKKADINIIYQGYNDSTLLTMAIEMKNMESVKMLIKKGTNVNLQFKNGKTPLMVASQKAKDLAIVKLLVEKGAKIDVKDTSGYTAYQFTTKEIKEYLTGKLKK